MRTTAATANQHHAVLVIGDERVELTHEEALELYQSLDRLIPSLRRTIEAKEKTTAVIVSVEDPFPVGTKVRVRTGPRTGRPAFVREIQNDLLRVQYEGDPANTTSEIAVVNVEKWS